MKTKKKVLISVGTTQFQQLIKYTDSSQFYKILKQVDFEIQKQRDKNSSESKETQKNDEMELVNLQILSQIGGKGQYIPQRSKYIRLSNQISRIYNESDFIICHGGAGTLLQNLHNGKKIISVANDTLAGNHQIELISKLKKEGYLLGFKNVQQLRENEEKVKQFLLGRMEFKQYEKVSKCILNDIIFGESK